MALKDELRVNQKAGELLRSARVEAKMTQKQVASKLQVSGSTISRMERGKSHIYLLDANKYVKACGRRLTVEFIKQ